MIKFEKKQNDDKYVVVTYVHNNNKISSNLKLNAEQWCFSDADADKYIKTATQLEKLIVEELYKRKLNYNSTLIMLRYMQTIENISSGFDIRSNTPLNDLAERFVNSYDEKYNESVKFCAETLEMVRNATDEDTYTKNWKRYDKHNELISEYMLDMKPVKDTDFKINLDSILKSASDLLEELIKDRTK